MTQTNTLNNLRINLKLKNNTPSNSSGNLDELNNRIKLLQLEAEYWWLMTISKTPFIFNQLQLRKVLDNNINENLEGSEAPSLVHGLLKICHLTDLLNTCDSLNPFKKPTDNIKTPIMSNILESIINHQLLNTELLEFIPNSQILKSYLTLITQNNQSQVISELVKSLDLDKLNKLNRLFIDIPSCQYLIANQLPNLIQQMSQNPILLGNFCSILLTDPHYLELIAQFQSPSNWLPSIIEILNKLTIMNFPKDDFNSYSKAYSSVFCLVVYCAYRYKLIDLIEPNLMMVSSLSFAFNESTVGTSQIPSFNITPPVIESFLTSFLAHDQFK
ncbi:hypothetical protein CONCODRAFT_69472 [Conidiobolus coronatus NRRL 28638]|uniref:Uncharacterized protein n=1 Tax=Conidiobolus coronatus (strain ATCC 28846 / CBS 209.66 / NRRL 28638) TaxID=796925 RepID=A0A137PAH7_CONC2|nr:hypothetical protein CONCODRAFT_69472 [Conidiobolus coronatus NRRL 28638]|eukprot:KXN71931.1 hypothetical protein CONCODRAFT_69472 [Conidiobolus coronatus NRRL 28638]